MFVRRCRAPGSCSLADRRRPARCSSFSCATSSRSRSGSSTHLRNPRGVLSSGQVNGNFAVWSRCSPHPSCRIVRYDIAARKTTGLAVPSGKVAYGPSVGPNGTVYYLRSTPPKLDADVTYAFAPPQIEPGNPMTTQIYFDRSSCATKRSDIYRIDDVEPVALGLWATPCGNELSDESDEAPWPVRRDRHSRRRRDGCG